MIIQNHPLESIFGMSSGTMDYSMDDRNEMIEAPQPVQGVEPDDDAEDLAIKAQIEDVYNAAFEGYRAQTEMSETCEPRYAARQQEVANGCLSIALSAIALRSKNKGDKRKATQFIPFGNNITNSNVIIADRNELLEQMAEKRRLASS